MENTTAVSSDALKIVGSLWEQLIHAPSHLLLLVLLVVIGIAVKASPIPNRIIPFLLIVLGGGFYPLLASPGNVDPSFPHPGFVLVIYGLLLGFGAIVAHLVLRKIPKFRELESGIVNAFARDDAAPLDPPLPSN